MAKFAYNNVKNARTSHTLFELNYSYYSCIFYKKKIDPYSKSKPADDLASELRELMVVY